MKKYALYFILMFICFYLTSAGIIMFLFNSEWKDKIIYLIPIVPAIIGAIISVFIYRFISKKLYT